MPTDEHQKEIDISKLVLKNSNINTSQEDLNQERVLGKIRFDPNNYKLGVKYNEKED
jgi:hypothetical protein